MKYLSSTILLILLLSACETTQFYQIEALYEEEVYHIIGFKDNDLKTGTWEVSYESGQICESGKFKADKRDGEWIGFHRDGSKSYQVTFIKGKESGLYKHYKNGKIKEKGSFKEGNMLGKWVEYYYENDMKPYAITDSTIIFEIGNRGIFYPTVTIERLLR